MEEPVVLERVRHAWPEGAGTVKESVLAATLLHVVSPQFIDDDTVICVLPSTFKVLHAAQLMSPKSSRIIQRAFQGVLGLPLALEAKVGHWR